MVAFLIISWMGLIYASYKLSVIALEKTGLI